MEQHAPNTDVASHSLWVSLHDGKLCAIESNLLERTLRMEIETGYINDFHQLGEGTRFILMFDHVESVQATTFVSWPGELPDFTDMPIMEQIAIMDDYRSKAHEESIDWNALQSKFPTNKLDISDATLTENENNQTLELQGLLQGDYIDDQWIHLYLRFQSMTVRHSSRRSYSLLEFLELGRSYWCSMNKTI